MTDQALHSRVPDHPPMTAERFWKLVDLWTEGDIDPGHVEELLAEVKGRFVLKDSPPALDLSLKHALIGKRD